MLSLFKSNKCKICRARRAVRYCLRTNKNICWHDCNELRIDFKCPEECKYALLTDKDNQNLFQHKTNADSMTEFRELLKMEIDKWIILPQEIFGNKIPSNMAENDKGRLELLNFFKPLSSPPLVPINYLYKKLNLKELIKSDQTSNPEEKAKDYLDKLIIQDWQLSADMLIYNEQYIDDELLENYITRHKSNKLFKKILEFDLLSAALSEDKKTAMVYFDINHKYDLTVVLKHVENDWKIVRKFCGKPELFNGENEAIQQVAVLLSKNELANAHKLLSHYSAIYPESADLNYYWGLYYAFSDDKVKSLKFFFNAVELDPDFIEARFNYANLLHHNKEYDKARKHYNQILKQNPEDLKTLNNLGAIHMDKKEFEQAEAYFKKILEIDSSFSLAQQNLDKLASLKE